MSISASISISMSLYVYIYMHISMLHDYCEYAERMEVRYMDVDVDMDTYR